MDVLGVIKHIFSAIGRILSLQFHFNGFNFSLGSMIVGLIVIGCSIQLLSFLFGKD